MSQPIFSNRLVNEKSPYLLQHAHNPVDWYPWCEEAFKAAKEMDRPIFLSIGYSTCHWCHIMEKESFENIEIAQLLNDTFINIKVDREEKPEVDSLYMEFAQAIMAGGAGWPLNMVLTPDLMPIFAATYLPADASHGVLGVKQLVFRIRKIWESPEEREQIIAQAGKIVSIFSEYIQQENTSLPAYDKVKEAATILFKVADPVYGGTKGIPKFPNGLQLCFLLRVVKGTSDSRALFYIEKTLEMMHRGGIYDHLGGGFSRYAVDEHWIIPHFEKMLYDNAILARTYLEAWEYTRKSFYREVAEEILNYIMREMTDPHGAFYSAQDADTEGSEGRFYTWTWNQIQEILGADAPLFCEVYNVIPGGNFDGQNLLFMRGSFEEYAAKLHLDPENMKSSLDRMKQKLFQERAKKENPVKDDQIITSWNGLAIYAFSKAAVVLNNPAYLDVAEKAATFISTNMMKEGTLFRRWRDGEARFDGCLDDYAFFIHGLLNLFEADRGSKWLELAIALTHEVQHSFQAEHGAFYLTNGKDPNLLIRRCEFYDGAEPSGNAVQAENLLRLYQITGVQYYLNDALSILKAAKEHIDLYPPGACYHLMCLMRYLDSKSPTIIISLNDEQSLMDEIKQMLSGHFIPNKSVIWLRGSDEELRDLLPICRNTPPIQGKTTIYICYSNHCLLPIVDCSKMWETFENL